MRRTNSAGSFKDEPSSSGPGHQRKRSDGNYSKEELANSANNKEDFFAQQMARNADK